MFNGIGYSVYLSNFEQMKSRLSSLYKEGSCIFTSFHISEEFDETYKKRAEEMCRYLHDTGYRILGDVSKKTLHMFGYEDILAFAQHMNISILRIDYGFSTEEIIRIGKSRPVCINASTITEGEAVWIAKEVPEVYAMHNFYPRPETGLDIEYFDRVNGMLKAAGVKVLAFIPGDSWLRGPIHETLPTLEAHRRMRPYAAYVDMMVSHEVDGVFVGDGVVSSGEAELIYSYEREQVLLLPAKLDTAGEVLYGRRFTVRVDSPRWLKRFQESREYSCFGEVIQPGDCRERIRGSITVDNLRYQRYSGEVQLIIEDLPADDRVNVLGAVVPEYQSLLDCIYNGKSVMLIK